MGCPSKEEDIKIKKRPRPKTLLLPNPILHIKSSLQSPGRWTTAGEVFPVRQLGQLEINFDKNESLSGELQDAIKRLSTGIPRSSTTYSMNYRPIIKDTPDDEDENGKLSSQSDAYLVVEAEQIRVIEPVSRAIQETIKLSNIRVWAAHQLDIGVVARFGTSDVALVFRCETDAKGVAAAIHANCLRLANEIKLAKERQRPLGAQNASLARLDPEPYNQYTVKYIGNCTVLRPTGIDIVRDAIGKLVTIHSENQWVEGQALISATTLLLKSAPPSDLLSRSSPSNGEIARVRLRYLSFMAIGNDPRMFGFIHLIGPEEYRCHVLCCNPTAIELSQTLQEACVLRYQKAVEAKQQRVGARCTDKGDSGFSGVLGAGKRQVQALITSFRRHTTNETI